MKKLIVQAVSWWNGATWGTRFFTWRNGTKVGEDEFGNAYYEGSEFYGRKRRWVIYADYAEASSIPPGWHGWMHHRVDTPPSEQDYKARDWEMGHKPSMTGTAAAYRPKGSMLTPESRPEVTGDYEAWTP
ncbi:MAG: NADH:ubiquinone oxidoreductase subunit NDUFA12 [Pseudomonadota bacterium]